MECGQCLVKLSGRSFGPTLEFGCIVPFLVSGWISAKDSLEDLIGYTSDHISQDSRSSSQTTAERVFFTNVNSKRLQPAFIELQQGDYKAAAKANRQVFGEKVSITSAVAQQMKEACQTGQHFCFRGSKSAIIRLVVCEMKQLHSGLCCYDMRQDRQRQLTHLRSPLVSLLG